jgi:hypothetical protein
MIGGETKINMLVILGLESFVVDILMQQLILRFKLSFN